MAPAAVMVPSFPHLKLSSGNRIRKFALTELFPTDLAIHMADVVSEIKGSGGFSFCEV